MTSAIDPTKILDADATPGEELRDQLEIAATEISALQDAAGYVAVATVTTAQVLALNATPVTVIAAPAAGYAIKIVSVEAYKAAGTAYAGIAAGEDVTLKYTNASGATLATIETTGFLDQATAQLRMGAVTATDITPVGAAAVVAHLLTGEITTGNSDLKLRITYRIIPTTF